MMLKLRRTLEMAWALLLNRRIRLSPGARIFGMVKKDAASVLEVGHGARVDGIEIHGRGSLKIGARVEIKNLYVDFGLSDGELVLEDDVFLAYGAKCIVFGRMRVGCGSIFGPDVLLVDTVHRFGRGVPLRASGVDIADVRIGANCWIGGRVCIMPGVCIEDEVVIGAGSVVTKSCSSHRVYGGVPAREIKSYD